MLLIESNATEQIKEVGGEDAAWELQGCIASRITSNLSIQHLIFSLLRDRLCLIVYVDSKEDLL